MDASRDQQTRYKADGVPPRTNEQNDEHDHENEGESMVCWVNTQR
jgi:hypothetical protein